MDKDEQTQKIDIIGHWQMLMDMDMEMERSFPKNRNHWKLGIGNGNGKSTWKWKWKWTWNWKERLKKIEIIGHWEWEIRRPLPSLGLGGAAPGITVGVRHGLVPALASKPQNLRSSFRRRAACLAMVPP